MIEIVQYYCLVQSLKMLFTYDERFLLLVPKGLVCPHHPEMGTSRASLNKFLFGQEANGKPSRMIASTSASNLTGSKVEKVKDDLGHRKTNVVKKAVFRNNIYASGLNSDLSNTVPINQATIKGATKITACPAFHSALASCCKPTISHGIQMLHQLSA